jgi:hypothetical protein
VEDIRVAFHPCMVADRPVVVVVVVVVVVAAAERTVRRS